MNRVQRSKIPALPMVCKIKKPCVYRVNLICDEPRINKGNSDATCHKMGNKNLIEHLHKSEKNDE